MRTRFSNSVLCFLLFGAHLLCASNGLETDSTKGKYPITDPRNPNCPCHKYQAEADKEYAKLLQKGGQHGNLEVKGEAFAGTKKPGKLRNHKWYWGTTRTHKAKQPKKKGFRDRLSRCFHF